MTSVSSDSYDRMPWALTTLLAAFVVVGLAASRLLPGAAESMEATLPDLSGAQLVEIRDASGRPVLSGEFRDRTDSMGNVHKDAALVDRRGRQVIGEIEVDVPGPQALQQPQKLDIDIIDIKPNAKFSVVIDDREVATFLTDDRGHVDRQISGAAPTPPGH